MTTIYTKDGKYYLKGPGKIFRIEATITEKGDVDFATVGETIRIFGDNDLIGYSTITIDEIKKNLTKKAEKIVEEPKVETERFPGLFESKKSNKKYK